MSYDYFLWRTNRVVEASEIDESTVETWTDIDAARKCLSSLWPSLVWKPDGSTADDCSGTTAVRSVRLPTDGKPHDPLVVRTSHRASAQQDLVRLGELLGCLVLDTQTGRILWQPRSDPQ